MLRTPLADFLVLCPSTSPLPAEGKSRLEVPFDGSSVEIWTQREPERSQDDVRLFILKFSGAGGRAERQTVHPADIWKDVPAEVWAVNPPGYGQSGGPARLRRMAPAAREVLACLRRVALDRPILVVGNSLGAAVALHLSATLGVEGLLLRNPPPLRQLIGRRHGWWNLWLPAMAVARGVPVELDSIRNAKHATTPAVFVSSGHDEIVPQRFQKLIINAYSGDKKVILVDRAKHTTPIPDRQVPEYLSHLLWLFNRLQRD